MLGIPTNEMLEQAFLDHPEFRSVAARMKILIAKTMYGVYFCLAIPKVPDGRFPLCPVGSGCSIDAHTAIQRASTELLQAMALFDASEKATVPGYSFIEALDEITSNYKSRGFEEYRLRVSAARPASAKKRG